MTPPRPGLWRALHEAGDTPQPTEADCQRTIIDAARLLGYRVAHFRPARTTHGWRTPMQGDPGFPDLIIAGHGTVIAAELKRRPNRVTDDQQAWIEVLDAGGVTAVTVWVPDGQQAFIDSLARARQR